MKSKVVLAIVSIIILFSVIGMKLESKADYEKNQVSLSSIKNSDTKKEDKHKEDSKKVTVTNKKADQKANSSKIGSYRTSVKSKTGEKTKYVYLTIDFSTFKKQAHYRLLKPELRKYAKNIYVLSNVKIKYYQNDTAFKVLQRGVKKYGIQMEYQGAGSNIYNSVYIQGLNHIYEFDAGSESGWMYSVNGIFPNYGMSAYKIKPNARLRMAYTVNLGCDVSGKSC